jgi:predicted outer membrane repeat protein
VSLEKNSQFISRKSFSVSPLTDSELVSQSPLAWTADVQLIPRAERHRTSKGFGVRTVAVGVRRTMPNWNIRQWLRPGDARVPHRRQSRGRFSPGLRLEQLEDRLTPSNITVTSSADSGAGTLRAVLASATSGAVVDFAANVRTIDLTSAGLTIATNVTIQNDLGTGNVTIDGGGNFTVFTINSSVTASLSGLTITHGATTNFQVGGGITNNGTLTVSDCTFSSNSSFDGGAIYSVAGLTVSNCTFSQNTGSAIVANGAMSVSSSSFSNNSTQQSGGAIDFEFNGSGTVTGCTFSSNTANDDSGAGIFNDNGTLTVSGCTFSNNSGEEGGGIGNDATLTVTNCTFSNNMVNDGGGGAISSNGTLTVSGSTFSGNSTDEGDGGAIDCDDLTVSTSTFSGNSSIGGDGGGINGDTITVSTCTFSGNSASDGGGIDCGTLTVSDSTFSGNAAMDGDGGGIDCGPLTVSDSTFSGNTAIDGGGIDCGTLTASDSTLSGNRAGIGDSGNGGAIDAGDGTLNGCIVAGNFNGASPSTTPDDIDAQFANSSDNLIGTGGSGGITNGVNGNQVGVSLANVGLAPLGNYGGPTQTFALLPGSFAIGKGQPAPETGTLANDQRGAPRPATGQSDVGAFQDEGYTLTATNTPQSANVNTAFALPLKVTLTENFAHDALPGAAIVFHAPASGASATLSSPALTNANGQTSVIATANGTAGGPYNVTAADAGTVPDMATFALTNIAVHLPTVTSNLGYTVALADVAGGNAPLPIDPTQLMATESGLSATQLTYTVKVLPLYGPLEKSGVALAVGSTFTQADINNGLITYQNTNLVGAAPTGVTTSFAFTVTDPNHVSTSQQNFVINFGRVKAVSSVTDGSGHLFNYIQFENGTVYRTPPFSLPLQQVVSTPTIAISAGTDNGKNADVTVEYASNDALWTYTNSGKTQLVFAQESAAGHTPLSIVAGLNGVVDVVFSDHQLWQANLAGPTSPTLITANVKFVTIGVHGTGASAVEADYVAFLDSGTTNGGVWEHYVLPGSGAHWVNVTSLDVYAISASQDLSDTADLIVSNRNNSGIVDHQVYGWRGTVGSLTEVTGVAVSSVTLDAAGNDYYVMQSTGGMYEHKAGVPLSTPATPIVTPHPTAVGSVGVANGQTNVADILFANGTYWQVSGLSNGTDVFTQVAT